VDENKTPIIARLKNFIESMAQFKKTVVDLSGENKVFAASIKLVAAAFVILLARANPIMGVLFGIAVLIDDINNGLRGNESFLLDIFKAFKTEDFGEGAMDVLIKKARAAAGTTEIWDRIKSNEKLRTEGLPKLRAKTAEQLRSFRREEQFGSALNLVPPANVSSAIGSGTAGPTQSILNQTNNIQGGPFAQDEVLNRTGDLLRADKEQVRVKRAN
jgi:hypothetical protein